MISLVFLLQQMGMQTIVVRGCIMVKKDVILLILLETKSTQSPEPLSPGPITIATTELQGTCLVSLDRAVNPGCAERRAWRDTEGRGQTARHSGLKTLLRTKLWEETLICICSCVNKIMLTSRIAFFWKGCIRVCIFSFEANFLWIWINLNKPNSFGHVCSVPSIWVIHAQISLLALHLSYHRRSSLRFHMFLKVMNWTCRFLLKLNYYYIIK